MVKRIPNCIPVIEGNELQYVSDAIETAFIASGPYVDKFENFISNYCDVKNSISTNTGTSALHIALILAGVKEGDAVILPNFTYAASANAVKYCNADLVFVDVSSDDWCMCPKSLNEFIEKYCIKKNGNVYIKKSNKKIAAIMPVHLYGQPVKLDEIKEISDIYNIPLVEDGAEALGAKYKDSSIGSGAFLCTLSFNGNKIITGGQGGMILTNNDKLAERARLLIAQARKNRNEFEHEEVGFNYKMPNLNAAFALAQAENLDKYIENKRNIRNLYAKYLNSIEGLKIKDEMTDTKSTYWMSILTVNEKIFKNGIMPLRKHLENNLIEARPVWQPLSWQKAYRDSLNLKSPNSESIYNNSICLPCSVNLQNADIKKISQVIIDFCESYSI
tara:strand:- start:4639 stop:5805 length:1167 start_codon:yes stop_codon:yes gene_type:complete